MKKIFRLASLIAAIVLSMSTIVRMPPLITS